MAHRPALEPERAALFDECWNAWQSLIRRFNHRPFLAAFLLAHLALTIPLLIHAAGWRHLISSAWFGQLDSGIEGTSANIYSGFLWGFVALLALAQIARSRPEVKPRWLMVVGWVSFGAFAALIAFEELASVVKDALGVLAASARLAALKISDLPQSARWLAVVAPVAIPMAAAASDPMSSSVVDALGRAFAQRIRSFLAAGRGTGRIDEAAPYSA